MGLNCPHAGRYTHMCIYRTRITIANTHPMLIWIWTLARKYLVCAPSFPPIANADAWIERFMCVSATRVVYWTHFMRTAIAWTTALAKLASQSVMDMTTDYNVHSLICAHRDNFGPHSLKSSRWSKFLLFHFLSLVQRSVFSPRWMAKIILNRLDERCAYKCVCACEIK